MATYKVIQDIEAEDKLVGPLTLRQFIYAGIAAICLYISFLGITKHFPYILIITLPIAGATGFFAFPWGKDQPTEVWALAKIRFLLKPRRRIWDQSGTKDLVTVTVPKKVERTLTNGLSQTEVQSRLSALASTIDSRGWAVKNVNVNLSAQAPVADISDRLVQASSFPQAVSDIDVRASDDILDEGANPIASQFDHLITNAEQAKRQQLMERMRQPATTSMPTSQPPAAPAQDYWFMGVQPGAGQVTFAADPTVMPGAQSVALPAVPQAAMPTADETALINQFKAANAQSDATYSHMKTLQPLSGRVAPAAVPAASPFAPPSPPAAAPTPLPAKPPVTHQDEAAIINLAHNNDLDVATIARQARKQTEQPGDDGEVVISLR